MNFFTPAEVAKNYIATGKAKVNTPVPKMLLLAVLAGAFIAIGGAASTTAAVNIASASVGKLVGACIFPGGLTMVLLAGSELFTGNCLLTIPLLEREITWGGMLKNWLFVYLGNFLGGMIVAAGVVFGHQPSLFSNGMAVSVGRLREDSQYDYKFVCLSHNTLRGAAGGAVLMAELLCAKGYMD